MLSRQRFNILTDTGGDYVDTGPPCSGYVLQIACDPSNFDTGVDLRLETVNTGTVIADYDNIGTSKWARSPRIATFDTGGTEIGSSPPVIAGDRIRCTVNQSAGVAGSKAGTIWVWLDGAD
jgi:hypothetical protein